MFGYNAIAISNWATTKQKRVTRKSCQSLGGWARSSARCLGLAFVFWVICSQQLKPSLTMMACGVVADGGEEDALG